MKYNRREMFGLIGAGVGGSMLFGGTGFAAEEKGKVYGIALVGLGSYSKNELGPALLKTKHVKLTGLVTGSPEKVPEWREKYSVPAENVYSYENFDDIKDNKDIDIIYVVLPTGMHAEYSIRAAKAGKHVICEKPMAASVEECDAMIAAADEAGVSLHIGYRLHWDPYHLRLMEASRKRELGEILSIESAFGSAQKNPNPNRWSMTKELGVAGALYDLGVYPIQASLYLAQVNPVRVSAVSHNSRPELFTEIEEGYDWKLHFPGGITSEGFASSGKNGNYAIATAAEGKYGVDENGFAYRGIKGFVGDERLNFPVVNQQALQMDGICMAISEGKKSRVPGEMGRRDIAILEAIMKSAETGDEVELGDLGYPAV